jgi:hypothetical protein
MAVIQACGWKECRSSLSLGGGQAFHNRVPAPTKEGRQRPRRATPRGLLVPAEPAYSWRMPGWSSKLTRPVAIKGGPVLRTLNDARAFVIDRLPEEDQDRVSWQRTAELLLAAAEGSAEIETATQQLERALFLQAKWLLPED